MSSNELQPLDEGDPIFKLVEQIQFGDPSEAGAAVKKVIGDEIAKGVHQTLAQQQANGPYIEEAMRSKRALEEFGRRNDDIKNDPRTRAMIHYELVNQQKADLKKMLANGPASWREHGYTSQYIDQLPEKDVTSWHLRLRTVKQPGIRSVEQLMRDAGEAFQDFTGRSLSVSGTPEELAHLHMRRRQVDADRVRGRPSQPWESLESEAPSQQMATEDGRVRTAAEETRLWMGDTSSAIGDAGEDRHGRAAADLIRMRNAAREGRVSRQQQQDALAALKGGGN